MKDQYACLMQCAWFFTLLVVMLWFPRLRPEFRGYGNQLIAEARRKRRATETETAYGYARAYLLVFGNGGFRRVQDTRGS